MNVPLTWSVARWVTCVLHAVGLGLGDGPGLDLGGELVEPVLDEGVDHRLGRDVVRLGDLRDGLAALEGGVEVGLGDPDRLGDDRGIADSLVVAEAARAGVIATAGTAHERAVDLVGRPLGDLRLHAVGLGLGDGPGLDLGGELVEPVLDEGVDHRLGRDVVRLGDLRDGLAALEGGVEVGLGDPDRLGNDRGIADSLVAAEAARAGVIATAGTRMVAIRFRVHIGICVARRGGRRGCCGGR